MPIIFFFSDQSNFLFYDQSFFVIFFSTNQNWCIKNFKTANPGAKMSRPSGTLWLTIDTCHTWHKLCGHCRNSRQVFMRACYIFMCAMNLFLYHCVFVFLRHFHSLCCLCTIFVLSHLRTYASWLVQAFSLRIRILYLLVLVYFILLFFYLCLNMLH